MNHCKTFSIMMVAAALLWGCSDDNNDNNDSTGNAPNDMMGAAGASATGMPNDMTGDMTANPGPMDIVDTALAAGSFTQLANALTAANLVDTLKGDGPFTVFAPTDDAFDAFEAANPGVLASLSTEDLTNVLLYHVVGDLAGSGDLFDGMQIATLNQGEMVSISLDGGVRVDDANVATADILTRNGVIHVIDAVITP